MGDAEYSVSISGGRSKIPLRIIPNNRVITPMMEVDDCQFVTSYQLDSFMEQAATAFSSLLGIPRERVDIVTHIGGALDLNRIHFQLIGHMVENRVMNEQDALRQWRQSSASAGQKVLPEFIDI